MLGAIITAAVTPFDADLRIDSDAFATLVRFLKQNSSDSVVVSGTTGEASTLDDDEKVELFRIACAERTDGFKVVVTGTTRANEGVDQFFSTANDADGVEHNGGTITATFATILPAENPGGADGPYTAGELKPGDTVTLTFNAIIQ